jgi:hypothetical protein
MLPVPKRGLYYSNRTRDDEELKCIDTCIAEKNRLMDTVQKLICVTEEIKQLLYR